MADEPMTDERLAEIRRMVSRAEVSMMAFSDVAVRDLLAEVDHLRAREAAAMAIVEKLVSLWLVTDDSHAPRRLTYLYPRDGAVDVEALREEARALLTQE